jgi:RNA polymerase primary sigma factor
MKQGHNHDNPLSFYLNEISKIPLLTKEEEVKLAHEAKNGSEAAKEKIIKSNLRFVVAVAKKYKNHGIPLADLINEGNIGLMKAITKFDVNVGCHFITYAVFWIRQAIIKAIYQKARMIRLPANRIKDLMTIERTKKMLETKLDREPSIPEIAKEIKLSEKLIERLLELSKGTISIESSVSSDQEPQTLTDAISDLKTLTPEKKTEQNFLTKILNSVLSTLPLKEREIVLSRFGLEGHKPLCLAAIAKKYNLSKERIRQIEKKALSRLRHNSRSEKLRFFIQDQ